MDSRAILMVDLGAYIVTKLCAPLESSYLSSMSSDLTRHVDLSSWGGATANLGSIWALWVSYSPKPRLL